METKDSFNTFYPKSRSEWRQWLQSNHTSLKSVWLIIHHKDSKTHSLTYEDAVEEALCFGWIDSKPNKRDDESYYLFFAQRKPKSKWSKANRERVEKMISEGLMTESGQAMIDLAKRSGTWTALIEVQDSVIPDDLQRLFDSHKLAFNYFQLFPDSSKRIILEWILNAKRPETRRKRIEETVRLAEKNIRANHYRQ
jgi:uncharacterized protein YdeI (YjbR/CyaY-like superfamily)